MVLNTTHFILIGVLGVVFIVFVVLISWLVVILLRRRKAKKAASQYPVSMISEINEAFGEVSGSDAPKNSQFHIDNNPQLYGHVSRPRHGRRSILGPNYLGLDLDYDEEADDDSGHGTTDDYENIHIDVIETQVDGIYAQPQKSTLKKKAANNNNVTVVNTMDKKVNFSVDIHTIIDDESAPQEQSEENASDKT